MRRRSLRAVAAAVCVGLVAAAVSARSCAGRHQNPDPPEVRTRTVSAPEVPRRARVTEGAPPPLEIAPTDGKTPAEDGAPMDLVVRRIADDSPVPDAQVHISPRTDLTRGSDVAESRTGTTDTRGMTRVLVPKAWLTSGTFATATARGSSESTRTPIRCVSGEPTLLYVSPCAVVEGRVVGIAPSRHSEVRVFAFSPDWAEAPRRREARIDEQGRFLIEGVPFYVSLFASAPGRVPSATSILRTDERTLEAKGRTYVELVLGPTGQSARLDVRLRSGRLLPAGVAVSYSAGGSWQRTSLSGDGYARLDGLAAATPLELHVWPARLESDAEWGSVEARLTIEPEEWARGTLSVTVEDAVRVTFRVADALGVPATGLRLRLVRVDDEADSKTLVVEDAVGGDGMFRPSVRTAVAPGRHELLTVDDSPIWSGDLEVGEPRLVPVTLAGRRIVSIVLTDWDGNPVRAGHVAAGVVRRTERVKSAVNDVTGDRGFFAFGQSSKLVIPYSASSPEELVVRLRVSGWGHVDHPLQHDSSEIQVPIPRETGVVHVDFGPRVRMARGVFDLRSESDPPVVAAGVPSNRGDGVWIFGVAPGVYSWESTGSSLPTEQRGSGFPVVEGRVNELFIPVEAR